VAETLRNGDPSIWLRPEGEDLAVVVHTLQEDEVAIVAQRLRAALA
jgi:GGDEF domain-containing protein